MRTLAVVAALFVVGGCGTDPTAVHSSSVVESLTFTSKTSSVVAGSYTRDGVVLGFYVDGTRMTLSDSGGAELVTMRHNGDGTQTMSLLGGVATVQAWTDADGTDHEVDNGDVDGVTGSVLARADAQLAPWLSAALGANGADGATLPVTLPLHALARQMGSATGVDPTQSPPPAPNPMCMPDGGADMAAPADMATATSDMAPPPPGDMATRPSDMAPPPPGDMAPLPRDAGLPLFSRVRPTRAAAPAANCQDLSGDPNCDNCFGMCGPGCTCWRWVCGDCCFHQGCADHDRHCRSCDKNHKRDCLLCILFDFARPLWTC